LSEDYIKKLEKWLEDQIKGLDVESSLPKIEVEKSEVPKPKSPGYSVLYCAECISKHLATAEKLLEEASTFARSGECDKSIGWVRDAVKELAGMEADVKFNAPKEMLDIVDDARRIRKRISEFKLEFVCNAEKLKEILDMIKSLRQKFYNTVPTLL
jgi:DNA repair ATPase RecN